MGRERPDVARSLNNPASLHQVLSRTADALPLTEKTLAGDRAQLRVALPVLQAADRRQLMPAEQRSRDRQAVISAERARLQKTLSSEFPNYAAGRAPIILMLRCSNRQTRSIATDGRAITTAKEGKAPQQLFERDQGYLPNKPKHAGSAWQARRSSVLGRRTGAGRLYSGVTATKRVKRHAR